MKTKEIEVWVYNGAVNGMRKNIEVTTINPNLDHYSKAKLIVEIPDEKLELSWEEIEEVLNRNPTVKCKLLSSVVKKQLGFKE